MSRLSPTHGLINTLLFIIIRSQLCSAASSVYILSLVITTSLFTSISSFYQLYPNTLLRNISSVLLPQIPYSGSSLLSIPLHLSCASYIFQVLTRGWSHPALKRRLHIPCSYFSHLLPLFAFLAFLRSSTCITFLLLLIVLSSCILILIIIPIQSVSLSL